MRRWKAILLSIVTMGVITIAGVMLLFRPLAESEAPAVAWPPFVAVTVYLVASVLLLDWASRLTRSSCRPSGGARLADGADGVRKAGRA